MDNQFYKILLDSIHDGVYFVNPQRVVTYWNKGSERISGYRAEEVLGKSCADNILRPRRCAVLERDPAFLGRGSTAAHHMHGHRV